MVEAAAAKSKMIYKYLGNTGLKVSLFSFGNWLTSNDPEKHKVTVDCFKFAYKNGINFFDTAEIYGAGKAEIAFGQAIKAVYEEEKIERKDLVISTKIFKCGFGKESAGPNDQFLSRKHIIEGLKNSLKRMEIDYVDVVFAHRPDNDVPLEETCRAFHWCIENGLAFYWATSDWSAQRITQAMMICEKYNLHKPVADQVEYNMLNRNRFEKEYRPIFEEFKYGTTIWSPLASGILSGKYNEGTIPSGSRFDVEKGLENVFYRHFSDEKKENTKRILNGLADIAKKFECTQAQLCLAWAIANGDVSTCIIGVSSVAQFEENIKALDVYARWNKDVEQEIRDLLKNDPERDFNWRTWVPYEKRRDVQLHSA